MSDQKTDAIATTERGQIATQPRAVISLVMLEHLGSIHARIDKNRATLEAELDDLRESIRSFRVTTAARFSDHEGRIAAGERRLDEYMRKTEEATREIESSALEMRERLQAVLATLKKTEELDYDRG